MTKPVFFLSILAGGFLLFYSMVLNDGMEKCQYTHTFDTCASTLW